MFGIQQGLVVGDIGLFFIGQRVVGGTGGLDGAAAVHGDLADGVDQGDDPIHRIVCQQGCQSGIDFLLGGFFVQQNFHSGRNPSFLSGRGIFHRRVQRRPVTGQSVQLHQRRAQETLVYKGAVFRDFHGIQVIGDQRA